MIASRNRRAWLVGIGALTACGANPIARPPQSSPAVVEPPKSDPCEATPSLVARAQDLEREGRLLRAAHLLAAVATSCRSSAVSAEAAAIERALDPSGEAGFLLELRAEAAVASGHPVEARRLFDRAAVALEKALGVPLFVEAFDPMEAWSTAWSDDGHTLAIQMGDSILLVRDGARRMRIPCTRDARVTKLTSDALTLVDHGARTTWDLASGSVRSRGTEEGAEWLPLARGAPIHWADGKQITPLGADDEELATWLEGGELLAAIAHTTRTHTIEPRTVHGFEDGQKFQRSVRIEVEHSVTHVRLARIDAKGMTSQELDALRCRAEREATTLHGGGGRAPVMGGDATPTPFQPVDCLAIERATFSKDGSTLVLERSKVREGLDDANELLVRTLASGHVVSIAIPTSAQSIVVARDGAAVLVETDTHGARTWQAYDLVGASPKPMWQSHDLPSFAAIEYSYDHAFLAWTRPTAVGVVDAKTGKELRRIAVTLRPEMQGAATAAEATCAAGVFRFPIALCDGVRGP